MAPRPPPAHRRPPHRRPRPRPRVLDLQARHGRVQAARAEQEALRRRRPRPGMLAASVCHLVRASSAC